MCSHADCRVEVLPDGQIDETHVLTDEETLIPFGENEFRAVQTTCSTVSPVELPKYNVATPQGIVVLDLLEYVELAGKAFSIPQKFEMGGSDGKSGISP